MTSVLTSSTLCVTFHLWLLHVTWAQDVSENVIPPQPFSTRCLAEWKDKKKKTIEVTCGSCSVSPRLCCRYNEDGSSSGKSVEKFDDGPQITCPQPAVFQDTQPTTGDGGDRKGSCRKTLDHKRFLPNNGWIIVQMTACNKTSKPAGKEGLYLNTQAFLSKPTPRFLPSCIDKTTKKCTCYIAKPDSSVIDFSITPKDYAVTWKADGKDVQGQKKDIDESALSPADREIYGRILTSSTIDIINPDKVKYTCRGKNLMDAVTKVFNKPAPVPEMEIIACNSTVKPGDIGSCSCYNKGADLNYWTRITWQVCEGEKKCKTEMPKNVVVTNRAFLSTVFYVSEEGAKTYKFQCWFSGVNKPQGKVIHVRKPPACDVATIAYIMIPITYVLTAVMIFINRRVVKWYVHVLSLAKLASAYMSEAQSPEHSEDGTESGII